MPLIKIEKNINDQRLFATCYLDKQVDSLAQLIIVNHYPLIISLGGCQIEEETWELYERPHTAYFVAGKILLRI